MTRLAVCLLALGVTAIPAHALETSVGNVTVTKMVDGLDEPWALDFLPGGEMLISERDGRLLHIADGQSRAIKGLPEIAVRGQGGLLDLLVPRDFAQSREIYFTYSKPQSGGAGTAIARARLDPGADRLSDLSVIFEMVPGSTGGRHFGSRLVEGRDGYFYATTGDRGDRPSAQDLGRENGSVIRIARDGAVPSDNPFVDTPGAQPEIWSYGHRNPQGAALDGSGALWLVEHGARGGDEVNRVEKGANYGWPVISYGRHYSGAKIGEGTQKEGMKQPAHYWDPSIAPSGMMIYQGDMFPDWRGDIFVGSLKFDMISRLDGSPLREVERLESSETSRVRDIIEGPDGAIWFLSVGQGAAYRITPN
ncbi:soluble aldose sugar dehydrogenase YliI precursor [Roseovarius sp. A-2]|uniref:PQQ-dependent sugar dehydrogenase n=1 Tax=Roseovarius sp. A-2 TaxID=1570360 RepID=UPI0009B51288|nr:PQQ-dependent sugar dehydrogenase [Roseovarius sp. A-2]GAW35109.1 soluble aldose sugar dehydrogenase YliI precursor [Roseovarius sp. A-2]